MKRLTIFAIIILCVGSLVPAVSKDQSILNEDFEQNPRSTGWSFTQFGFAPTGRWITGAAHSGTHFITAQDGHWNSPMFPISQRYYKLTFYSKALKGEQNPNYCVIFYDSGGQELREDHCGSFDPSDNWRRNEIIFRGKRDAVKTQVRFLPPVGVTTSIDDVRVEPITPAQALTWEDALCRSLPPLKYVPPKQRFGNIPRTMAKLKTGGTVRIVLLGDAIMNDIGSTPLELMINRHYPKAKVEVMTFTSPSEGTWYFREEDRMREVAALKPDLLMIGGISGTKPEDNREVIRQLRQAGSRAEVVLMTGPVTPRFDKDGRPWSLTINPKDNSPRRGELLRAAQEDRQGFLDIQSPFSQYECLTGKPPSFFRRDAIHPNDRGRAVLAKIVEIWFSPDTPKTK